MAEGRTSLSSRLLTTYAVTFLVVLGVSGFSIERAARDALVDEIQTGMAEQLRSLSELVPGEPAEIAGWTEAVGTNVRGRITVIDADGMVVGDSIADAETMENHAGRPEFQAALDGRVGTDRRVSATTGVDQLYVAIPLVDRGAIRVSLPANVVDTRIEDLRTELIAIVTVAGVAGVIVVAYVARRLARPITALTHAAGSVARGDLDIEIPRSSIEELDRLGTSVGTMARDLGARLDDVEGERKTLGLVLDALAQGTILIGPRDEIMYANRAVEDLLGPVPAQLSQLVPFRIQDMVRRARSAGPVGLDVEHGRPVRILRIVATAIDEGRTLVVVGDVTERRRVNEIRRDFVANASHELKTPVSSILAAAETLQLALERAPERVPRFAAQIEASAQSLARLVSDLLDLSRLEGGIADLGPVNVASVVRTEVSRIEELAEEGGITVESDVQPVTVAGSVSDLGQAVRNLLDNAVRYTEEGGRVQVATWEHEGQAVITISDTGTGIPQRDLGRIFERFYRVDVARSRATGGTGLGLSIVKHVVESHGGTVDVQSELGAGSSFTVRIPSVPSSPELAE